jgi:hypothetical protein
MTADLPLGRPECCVAVANTGSTSAAALRRHAPRAGIATATADPEHRLGARPPVRRPAEGVRRTELADEPPLGSTAPATVLARAASVTPTRRARALARDARTTLATATS